MADAVCPHCEPENPAARYADTCVVHRLREGLPVHYFDCDRFEVYDYGTRQGKCDCTATADVEAVLRLPALRTPCWCGNPGDRARVHRAQACEAWQTPASSAVPAPNGKGSSDG